VQRAWRLLALGVAVYLLILVTTFPAARVTGIMQERVSDLSILAVSGSVFSGKAGQVVWQDLDLGSMHWQFRPVALLLGRIEYLIELTHPANSGQLVAGITLIGSAYVQNLELTLLPDRILNHYSPVEILTSGELLLDFEKIDVSDVFSDATTGQLAWQDAVILEPVNMVLGQLQIDVQGNNGTLVGEVTEGGELNASGELSLLPAGGYRLNLTLHPGPDVTAETLDMLEHTARMQPNGDYLVEQSGQF
jgi:general secretion pathway protein N